MATLHMQLEDTQPITRVTESQASLKVDIIFNIAKLLNEIIQETDALSFSKTVFHASRKPSISIEAYLARISKYCKCSIECYILALIYMDSIQEYHPEFILNQYSVHRFLMTAIVLAIKYHDDEYYKNEFYAKIAGISLKEMNDLEKKFLELTNFRLFVNLETFSLYLEKIQQYSDI